MKLVLQRGFFQCVFREHYVKVSRSTPMSPLPPGDYPDALVPQDFAWQPLPAVKQVNQPWWIDVHAPHGSRPGKYSAEVIARDAMGAEMARTKLMLRVSDFDLPVVPRLRTSIDKTPLFSSAVTSVASPS